MALPARVGVAQAKAISAREHAEWAKRLWTRIDRNRNGRVSRDELNCDEFQDALRSIIAPAVLGKASGSYSRAGQNTAQLMQYCLQKADINNDGCLSLEEFESFTRELRNQRSAKDTTGLIFALFDLDGDQYIDKEEFAGIYRFYLGAHPMSWEFKAEWDRLDRGGRGRVSREQFTKWLPHSKNVCFHQHAKPVSPSRDAVGMGQQQLLISQSSPATASSGSRPSPKKAERIFRPAPGLVPRRTGATPTIPAWNDNFASKDPSEQNLAVRGNLLMKSYFSRPQSLPELRRFYMTYQGFESSLQRLDSPPPPPLRKPVLSEETWEMSALPGLERHAAGGGARNARGEELPWRELTPRALKKIYREPGSMLLRAPTGNARLVTPWTERRRPPARAPRRAWSPPSPGGASLEAPRGGPPQDSLADHSKSLEPLDASVQHEVVGSVEAAPAAAVGCEAAPEAGQG